MGYCGACGTKAILVPATDYPQYDTTTGERRMEEKRPNSGCRLNCRHTCGFFSSTCGLCGTKLRIVG